MTRKDRIRYKYVGCSIGVTSVVGLCDIENNMRAAGVCVGFVKYRGKCRLGPVLPQNNWEESERG